MATLHHTHEHNGGRDAHHILCRESTSGCYRKAEALCPRGYLIFNRIRGVDRGGHREFELRIRCRGSKIFY